MVYGAESLPIRRPATARGRRPHPLVVVIHGGYWQAIYNLVHAGHLCVDLAKHGIASWNVEYRRIGDVGGHWITTADDIPSRARAHTCSGSGLPNRSREGGSHRPLGRRSARCLELPAHPIPLRRVVSIAGVVDMHMLAEIGDDHGMIERLLGGARKRFPTAGMKPHRGNTYRGQRERSACGTADVHSGPTEATAEAALAAGSEVELLPLPGAGHFEPVDPAAPQWRVVRAKIQELLEGKTADGS